MLGDHRTVALTSKSPVHIPSGLSWPRSFTTWRNSQMTSFKLTEFSCWKGTKTLVSLRRNQIPDHPPSDVCLGCSVYLLIPHGAHQLNLVLPGCPHLKTAWKTLSKGAPWATTEVLRHFMHLQRKGTLKTLTHTHKLASKLKLRMNHRTHFLTLICGLLTTDTHNLLSSLLGFWSFRYNDEHRLKMEHVKEEAVEKR